MARQEEQHAVTDNETQCSRWLETLDIVVLMFVFNHLCLIARNNRCNRIHSSLIILSISHWMTLNNTVPHLLLHEWVLNTFYLKIKNLFVSRKIFVSNDLVHNPLNSMISWVINFSFIISSTSSSSS